MPMNIIKTKRGYMGLCYCLRSVCIGSRTHFLDNTFFIYQVPDSHKSFKLFCFSQLFIYPFHIEKGRIKICGNKVSFLLSFYVDKTAKTFIGAFQRPTFPIGQCGMSNKFPHRECGNDRLACLCRNHDVQTVKSCLCRQEKRGYHNR